MEPEQIIKQPISTEKAIRMMESENKLCFVVDKRARKPEIKTAVEKLFNVKVMKVNVYNTIKGQKRAYVRLSPETPAIDVSTRLGMM